MTRLQLQNDPPQKVTTRIFHNTVCCLSLCYFQFSECAIPSLFTLPICLCRLETTDQEWSDIWGEKKENKLNMPRVPESTGIINHHICYITIFQLAKDTILHCRFSCSLWRSILLIKKTMTPCWSWILSWTNGSFASAEIFLKAWQIVFCPSLQLKTGQMKKGISRNWWRYGARGS